MLDPYKVRVMTKAEKIRQEDRELSARVNLIYRNPPPRESAKIITSICAR